MTLIQAIQIGLLVILGIIILSRDGYELQLPALGIGAVLTATISPWMGILWLNIYLLVIRNKLRTLIFGGDNE